jgi:hypothetical protein
MKLKHLLTKAKWVLEFASHAPDKKEMGRNWLKSMDRLMDIVCDE